VSRGSRVTDLSGSFLNDLDRIATRTYEPSDDDIVRARLRTLGIQEYKIQFEQNSTSFLGSAPLLLFVFLWCIDDVAVVDVGLGGDFGQEWLIYDVGGSRTAVCFSLCYTWLYLTGAQIA